MPKCPKCGTFTGEMEKECPSCLTPLTSAASGSGVLGGEIRYPIGIAPPMKWMETAVDALLWQLENAKGEIKSLHASTTDEVTVATLRNVFNMYVSPAYGNAKQIKKELGLVTIEPTPEFWRVAEREKWTVPGFPKVEEPERIGLTAAPEFVDEIVNREYWTAALRKIPPFITDEESDTVKYEEFADLLELAGARYSAEIVRTQIAALEKGHAELLKSIQGRMLGLG
jgi:hypothetical protein